MKFENLIVGLNVLIISFILAKFQKNQRSITYYIIKQMLKFQVFVI